MLGAFVTALLGIVAILAVPSPASAVDRGDGLLACTVGEICLKKHNDTAWTSDLRHFWYNDLDHNNDTWSGPQGGTVGENASMYWNRDTACDVYILDYKPVIGLYQWLQIYQNGSSWYFYAGDYLSGGGSSGFTWNDLNDGHRRCAPS